MLELLPWFGGQGKGHEKATNGLAVWAAAVQILVWCRLYWISQAKIQGTLWSLLQVLKGWTPESLAIWDVECFWHTVINTIYFLLLKGAQPGCTSRCTCKDRSNTRGPLKNPPAGLNERHHVVGELSCWWYLGLGSKGSKKNRSQWLTTRWGLAEGITLIKFYKMLFDSPGIVEGIMIAIVESGHRYQ